MEKITLSQFTESLFTKQSHDGATNFGFQPRELQSVESFIVDNSLIGTLGTSLQLDQANGSNATFMKNIGQTFKNKTAPGPNNFESARYEKVTLTWTKPLYQSVAFTAADFALGVPTASGVKLEKAAADYSRNFERIAWSHIETEFAKTTGNVQTVNLLDTAKLKPQDVYAKVVALGTALTKHKDDKEGIDGISKNNIIIHVKPEVLDYIAQSGIVGNYAETSFLGGQYSVAMVGGYRVIANEYLDKFDALATTTFACASLVKVIAANYERLQPTNDWGLYFEAMGLYGLVYNNVFRAIKAL